MTGRLLATFAVLLVTTSCASAPPVPPSPAAPSGSPAPTSTGSTLTPRPSPAPKPVRPARPLAGVTIALDPGHQLGNHNFPAETGRIVEAGGLRKPCNTTGTATADGWPEATFAFEVGRVVARRLEALGARVELTRSVNSEDRWGPCVDVRGRFARRVGADLLVSLHADGAPEGEHGFHVIAPPGRAPSLRLAEALRAGLVEHRIPRSTYVADGLAVRADLGTLNLAGVPAAMLELGNMRNAEDARRMRSAEGQALYAAGVVRGIRRYLHR